MQNDIFCKSTCIKKVAQLSAAKNLTHKVITTLSQGCYSFGTHVEHYFDLLQIFKLLAKSIFMPNMFSSQFIFIVISTFLNWTIIAVSRRFVCICLESHSKGSNMQDFRFSNSALFSTMQGMSKSKSKPLNSDFASNDFVNHSIVRQDNFFNTFSSDVTVLLENQLHFVSKEIKLT